MVEGIENCDSPTEAGKLQCGCSRSLGSAGEWWWADSASCRAWSCPTLVSPSMATTHRPRKRPFHACCYCLVSSLDGGEGILLIRQVARQQVVAVKGLVADLAQLRALVVVLMPPQMLGSAVHLSSSA